MEFLDFDKTENFKSYIIMSYFWVHPLGSPTNRKSLFYIQYLLKKKIYYYLYHDFKIKYK